MRSIGGSSTDYAAYDRPLVAESGHLPSAKRSRWHLAESSLCSRRHGSTSTGVRGHSPAAGHSVNAEEMHVWGAWEVQAGYVPSGTGAIEIRCFRLRFLCVEADANLLQYAEGEDLAAEVRLYRITSWSDEAVEAEQLTTDADCVHDTLQINQVSRARAGPGRASGNVKRNRATRSWSVISCMPEASLGKSSPLRRR